LYTIAIVVFRNKRFLFITNQSVIKNPATAGLKNVSEPLVQVVIRGKGDAESHIDTRSVEFTHNSL